jgi:hypothetical protein
VIAVDTSSWIAFLSGDDGPDVVLVERALAERQVSMPPVILTELLNDPHGCPSGWSPCWASCPDCR